LIDSLVLVLIIRSICLHKSLKTRNLGQNLKSNNNDFVLSCPSVPNSSAAAGGAATDTVAALVVLLLMISMILLLFVLCLKDHHFQSFFISISFSIISVVLIQFIIYYFLFYQFLCDRLCLIRLIPPSVLHLYCVIVASCKQLTCTTITRQRRCKL